MQIVVEPEECVCSGNCVSIAPAIFDQDEDAGVVVLLLPKPPEHEREKARYAARACPALAIHIEES